MSHLAILGAGGHGKVVADTASLDPKWQTISFFDDAWPFSFTGSPWPLVGDTNNLLDKLLYFDGVIVAIGDNNLRQKKHELLVKHQASLAVIIHPTAYVSPNAHVGLGSVIFSHSVINIDAKIGYSGIVNTGATIDHDCELADYVHISPGVNLSGGVHVGVRSWIGVGSAVRQGISIGMDAVVGAGAAVVEHVADKQTVVGVPAKPLKTNS